MSKTRLKVSRPTSDVGSRMAVCWSTLTAIFCWSSSHQSALWGPNISLINFSSLSPRPGGCYRVVSVSVQLWVFVSSISGFVPVVTGERVSVQLWVCVSGDW